MYTIHYDAAKNRVAVQVIEINKNNVNDYIAEMTELLENVKPGFTGIADMSEGKLFTMEVADKLSHLGQLSVDHGMSKWAYFTGSTVSKMQMKRMFGDLVNSFNKLEDAEAFLDNE
ncbi:hypothetical protein MUG84_13295 [Paenibacillus sp. KQZ6P-2]|uniref:Uncharacterized protein n=1 Tax=Paenibacillus mangrovi TaxID=2931978 RepID=A0A9X2B5H6_9BACL|nr:hypothetical protein [Paenibacillus mangrovi]MCJ8012707.1 hypothetical protein [Paenibacillus mangrovi]